MRWNWAQYGLSKIYPNYRTQIAHDVGRNLSGWPMMLQFEVFPETIFGWVNMRAAPRHHSHTVNCSHFWTGPCSRFKETEGEGEKSRPCVQQQQCRTSSSWLEQPKISASPVPLLLSNLCRNNCIWELVFKNCQRNGLKGRRLGISLFNHLN